MTRDDTFARSEQRCVANRDNIAGTADAPTLPVTSEDSHWFGIALLLAGLFLLTVLLMTVAIILVADHQHNSFASDPISTASVAVVGTQLLDSTPNRQLPGRIDLQSYVIPSLPTTLPLVATLNATAAQLEIAHRYVLPLVVEAVRE
jgi:hypothetical protein